MIYQRIRRTGVLAATGDFFCRAAKRRAFRWSSAKSKHLGPALVFQLTKIAFALSFSGFFLADAVHKLPGLD